MPAAHAQGHVRARVCIRHTCARTRVCRMDAQSIARRRAAGMHTYAGWHRGHRKGANCSWEERTTLSLSLSLSLHTRRRGVRHQQFVGGEQYYCYYYSLPPPLRTPVRCTYARRETRARKGCAGNYSSTPTLLRSAKAWCVCVCVCVYYMLRIAAAGRKRARNARYRTFRTKNTKGEKQDTDGAQSGLVQ